jgi:tetratricopeptide (TPR) repeat protein
LVVKAHERAAPGSLSEASALRAIGEFRAWQGEIDEGRVIRARARDTFREAGLYVTAAGGAMGAAEIEWRAGDYDEQERILRDAVETLEGFGDQFFFSTVALRLVDCLLQTRSPDDEEIARLVTVARERTLAGDLVNFVYLDGIEARRLAHAGSVADAKALAHKAAETADTTDNFDVRSHAWQSLAETLMLAAEPEEARRAATRSIEIRAAKGDVAGVAALERAYHELGLEVV